MLRFTQNHANKRGPWDVCHSALSVIFLEYRTFGPITNKTYQLLPKQDCYIECLYVVNSSPPGQFFADDIFRRIFVNEKFCMFWLKFTQKFVPKVPNDNKLGLDNGLVPDRRRAIIWTNADPIHWRIHPALVGDELSYQQHDRHFS